MSTSTCIAKGINQHVSHAFVLLQVKATGKYLLGCAITSCNAWLLLATDIDPKPAVKLPGGHYVFNVTGHRWESIPLQVRSPSLLLELLSFHNMLLLTSNNCHVYIDCLK
jgi:hypothetical protein